MTTTWISKVDLTSAFTADSTWNDVDVSSNVSASATGVILTCDYTSTAVTTFGLRKNGSTDTVTARFDDNHMGSFYVGVDGSAIFEMLASSKASLTVWLVGYFEDEAFFRDNAAVKSVASSNTWLNVDISGDLDGSDVSYAAMGYTNRPSHAHFVGYRADGGTDNRTGFTDEVTGVFVKTVSDVFEMNTNQAASTSFYLLGYIKDNTNINLDTNLTEVTPTTKDSWEDVTQSGSTGQFLEGFGSDLNFGYRADGDTGYTATGWPGGQTHCWGGVGEGATIDVYVATGQSCFRIGYTTAPVAGGTILPQMMHHHGA